MQILRSADFERQVKKLVKKHRQILDDIADFLDQLERGERPGKPLQGHPIRWARIRNRSARSGKSGGFRIVYYFDDALILLITIDTRSEFRQLPTYRLELILKEFVLD